MGVVLLMLGIALGGGYWWGSSASNAATHETEWRLQAAFRQGEKGASLWAALMEWNPDILGAVRQCRGDFVSIQGGRKGCEVPLWIEAPPAPTP